MVDLETTGTSVDNSAIIQIAAVKFDYASGEVGAKVFNECLMMAPNRFWTESTRSWWGSKRAVLNSIIQRMREPGEVVREFDDWLEEDKPEGGYQFWAKPTTFDFPLITSYFRQYDLDFLSHCHFRFARDMNSFIAGLRGSPEHVDMNHILLEHTGPAHDGLSDCIAQLRVLFAARDGRWN